MIMITPQIITVLLFLPTLLSLLLFVSPIAATSSPTLSSSFDQEQAKAITAVSQTSSDDDHRDQVDVPAVPYEQFYIKKMRAPMRSLTGIIEGSETLTKTAMNKLIRKKIKIKIKNSSSPSTNARANFSAMLPKGFVPPSGSSPCHNGNPNSVVFFCSKTKP